ncbi:terpene synthase 2 [Spatholobus suberectus]|nr:terpene synthase 2 [Spatholobus suberectus]
MRKQGKEHFVKYAKKEMKRLVQVYIIEAIWFHCNHTPTIEEYMQVATISCGYASLTTVSFLGMEDTTEEVLIWAKKDPKIVTDASIICRLTDDTIGSEKKVPVAGTSNLIQNLQRKAPVAVTPSTFATQEEVPVAMAPLAIADTT